MGRYLHIFLLALVSLPEPISTDCPKNGICTEDLEKIRIRNLARKLYDEVPDMPFATNVDIDTATRQLYQDLLNTWIEEKSNFADDHEVKLHFLTSMDPSVGEDPSQLVATFVTHDELNDTQLVDATLIFFTRVPSHLQGKKNRVNIQVFEKGDDSSIHEIMTTDTISIKGNEKIQIDLPIETVKRWFSKNSSASVFVAATVDGTNIAIHPQQTTKDSELMILQIATKYNGIVSPSRKRRSFSTAVCTTDNKSPGCCLYDLHITFEEIGWDWIIAPPKYNAYMCRGDCKLNSHHFMNDYAHSKILRSAGRNHQEEITADVGFCCHPTDYEYIRLIYVNRLGRISVANVNGMIARRCGCS